MRNSFLHYQIIEKLGEGGMGIVYHARDTKLKREVALKFLPKHISGSSIERQRFEHEAQSAAALNHPNVTQIYAIEECADELFLVMEYVQGRELKTAIDDQSLSVAEKCDIARQVADGLKAAHEKGVIHRDIKSRNIMLTNSGQAKIMDFGLARQQGTDHITKTGTTLGTTAYMAPEQMRGEDPDERSDIWSYGVVLYELFAGTLPFQGLYEPAVMYAIMEEDPISLKEHGQEVPDYIAEIIHQCLVKDPGLRYQSMEAVIADLSQAGAKVPKLQTPGSKPARKTPQLIKVGGIPLLLLIVAGALFFQLYRGSGNALPKKRYLAVLPIENIGDDPGMQAICEGLAETFSYKLSELGRFAEAYWVAPASEMRQEQVKSVSQASKKFGVNLAIISSLQAMKDSTRLIMELVDADKIHRLATKQVVVPGNDLPLLEQKGVQAVMEMLDIENSPEIDQTLNEASPEYPEAYAFYLRGRAALQDYKTMDSLEVAIENFRKAKAIDPQYPLAYAGLGEAYWRKYELIRETELVQLAEEALQNANRLNGQLAPVQYLFGVVRSGTGDYDSAISHFRQTLQIDPNYTEAYKGLAGIYEQQGDFEKAITTYEYAITLQPEVWIGYSDLGRLYIRRGDFVKATQQFQKVISLAPQISTGYANLGSCYYYEGEYEKAIEAYQMSLALENDPTVANNLGAIYYMQEKYEKAAEMYRLVLQAMPDRYEIWANLAAANEIIGKSDESREAYLTAIEKVRDQLEINPNDAELMADLGAYYSDTGDSINARKFIEKALARNDDNIFVRSRAVSTYEKLGMREEALRWITEPMIADLESQPELQGLVQDVRFQAMKRALKSNSQ